MLRTVYLTLVAALLLLAIGLIHPEPVPAESAQARIVVAMAEKSAPNLFGEGNGFEPSLLDRFKSGFIRFLTTHGIDAEIVKLYAKWIVGAPILVVFIILVMLLRPSRKPPVSAQKPVIPSKARDLDIPPESKIQKPQPAVGIVSDKEQVLHFFLQHFLYFGILRNKGFYIKVSIQNKRA